MYARRLNKTEDVPSGLEQKNLTVGLAAHIMINLNNMKLFFCYNLGVQAQLWTETVRTKEQLHEMLFPRLLAFAERVWYKAPWESVADKQQYEVIYPV